MTPHVLILRTHRSARSVLSETLPIHMAQRHVGSAPSGHFNPHARVMLAEAGVDVSCIRRAR